MKIPPTTPRRTLRPPQFGLRTLLLAVTACAVVFALSQWLTPITVGCLVLLVASIVAHVAGNVIGTRLREIGDEPDRNQRRADDRPKAGDYAPVTRLGQRTGLGWPIVFGTLAGIIVGGVGGGVWTLLASQGPVGPLNVGVGVVAFSVLGGIGAFAVIGFVQVGVSAIRQAMQQIDPPGKL